MPKEDVLKFTGVVKEVLPNAVFKIELSNNKHIIIGHVSGKIRKANVNILLGDTVDVEVTPYDLTRGRIIWRYK